MRTTFAIGDGALLLGVVVATTSAGHFDLRALDDVVVGVDSSGALTLIALLLTVAALVRSAVIPFVGWLPSTLVAPT
ncbi:MAG: proton-conducting transporter membrane subunit, partial [Actinomycetota bacterium]